MGVHLGGGSGIKQGVHINLAGVSSRRIAVTLIGKTAGSTRIICRLGGKSGCGYDGIYRHADSCQRQEQKKSTQIFATHLPSGAELQGPCACVLREPVSRGGG